MNISIKGTLTIAYIHLSIQKVLLYTCNRVFAFCHYSKAKTKYKITIMNFCFSSANTFSFVPNNFLFIFRPAAVINLFVLS